MSQIKFYWIDSFTDEAFKGNPAGVCLLEQSIPEQLMQALAKEINLSETAFAVKSSEGRYQLRWFTPSCEVDMCGHATLATAKALWEAYSDIPAVIEFDTRSGVLTVERKEDQLQMNFPVAATTAEQTPEALTRHFGNQVIGCAIAGSRLIVELSSVVAVKQWQFDKAFVMALNCDAFILTSAAQSDKFDFVSRVFAPKLGIDEDPVTGAAHCALVDYWSKRLDKSSLRAWQASARGGELLLELEDERVNISGQAVMIMHGYLNL